MGFFCCRMKDVENEYCHRFLHGCLLRLPAFMRSGARWFLSWAFFFAVFFTASAHAFAIGSLTGPQFSEEWLIVIGASAAALGLYLVAQRRGRKAPINEAGLWEESVEAFYDAGEARPTVAPKPVERSTVQLYRRSHGEVYRDAVDDLPTPEMIVIPPGRFVMGSPPGEEGRNAFSEGEQREVTISKPFAVSRFLITFDEYDAFCWDRRWATCGDEGWGRGRMPIINVSWIDAYEYVKWLSSKTGKMYRLISEAEWEYCCRAGTQTPFSFGDTISTDQANYNGGYAYGDGQKGEYRGQTTPVDMFPANAFGVHDMHGNVWEWVEDVWSEGYAGAPVDETPALSGDRERRVLRGGSWYSLPVFLRSANRVRYVHDFRDDDIGFRVACTL